MSVYCSIIFSFCRRSVARAYHPRAPRRNNISEYCCAWQPCSAANPAAGCNPAFSDRSPELAFDRLPWAAQSGAPFAIAGPRTSAPRSKRAMVYPRACYPRAGYPCGAGTPAGAARNLLQDWRAQDSVAPADGNTRQIQLTTYSWPTARTWPLDHGSVAPRPDDQTWGARNSGRSRSLLGWLGKGQAACG